MATDSFPDAGATPTREANDPCVTFADGERRSHGKHHFIWVWKNGAWTDEVKCSTCGEVRNYRRNA